MKKYLYILAILAGMLMPAHVIAGIHSYASNSVLASGKWVKIEVRTNGVYRLSFSDIRKAGLNPANLRIYGYGGGQLTQDFSRPKIDDLCPVPYYMGNDFVLFYGQGNIRWECSPEGTFSHVRSTYSNYGYYFLSDNAGTPMLLNATSATISSGTNITTYTQLHLHERDSINLLDLSGVDGGGKEFYGEQFGANTQQVFNIATHDLTGDALTIHADVAGFATQQSTFRLTHNGNNRNADMKKTTDFYTKGVPAEITLTSAPQGAGSQSVTLRYESSATGGLGYLNYIEVFAPANLTMHGSHMRIQTTQGLGSSENLKYTLSNANSGTQIWDITDLSAITSVGTNLSGTSLSWNGSNRQGVRTYIAVNTNGAASTFLTPTIVGEVENQNLHALSDIDYVVICPKEFLKAARMLADKHATKDHYTTAVVTDEQVYNEFSSGTPDATAYRWLMKMLYDRAHNGIGNAPQNLLLFGDGTFDNRKLCAKSGNNWLLTYQADNSVNEVNAYATDDYFGFLGDNEGLVDTQGRMKIGVGRLPVNSPEEAEAVARKICNYMDNPNPGQWKQNITFLADDGDNGTHTITAEAAAERVRQRNPSFIINKIFLDAYTQESSASGESYPVAYNRFRSLLNNGTFYMDYSGHGGYNTITNENMLSIADARAMTNKNLGFWMLATCSYAHFDAGVQSSAEEAVNNPNGGALGVMSATRTVYATQNTVINRNVCDTLLSHRGNPCGYGITLGAAASGAKNATGTDANKMPYVLLADPGLQLNYPTQYQILTDSIDGSGNGIDTLRALSIHTIYGHIADEDGLEVSDFNGTLDIVIYDKMQTLTTLDNDETDPDKRVQLYYNDYPNKIFRGKASVVDGQFQVTFLTPKDIRYNYGNGRIAYYAVDTLSYDMAQEALGHYENFVIGGSNPLEIADTIGPEMTLYLNNPLFINGSQTHDSPHFYAELQDEHGINSAGNGIGHDLLLTLDGKETTVLNNYFVNEEGSYQAGLVSYAMSGLTNGKHTLTFRAWDLLNNSTTKSLDFEVVNGKDPEILGLVAYPNPVTSGGILNIAYHYDRPDEVVEATLEIVSMRGQLVTRVKMTQENSSAGFFHISPQQYGMTAGVYGYRVSIKTMTHNTYATSCGKIIVK